MNCYMKESEIYQTLKNFIAGKYSYDELVKIKHWLNNPGNYPQVSQFLNEDWQKIINEAGHRDTSLNHIFQNIEYQILLEERKNSKQIKLWSLYKQVAAILLIPVIIFSLYYYSKPSGEYPVTDWVQIHSPAGARTEFMLPDGSKGWLNSRSSIKYQPQFLNDRKVELSGEAYFEVKKDDSPFTVSVKDVDINVLGTQFNVSAYPGDQFTEIVLDRGKVQIEGTSLPFHKTLLPGNKLAYENASGKYSVNEVDSRLYSAWKEGFLMMDNEMLKQAVNRIERWYNVDIEIEDEELKNYRYKATFKDEPLEEILRLIALTTPIDYEIEERLPGVDGLYRKKRVIIRLKS